MNRQQLPDPTGPAVREHDPDWYRCNYMLAVAHSILAEDDAKKLSDAERRRSQNQARKHALETATELEAELIPLARKKPGARSNKFDFLIALEPTVLVLLASVILRWDWGPKGNGADSGPYGYGLPEGEPLDPRWLLDALEDATTGPEGIIKYVMGLNLDFRARYNLACYYVRLGKTIWLTDVRGFERALSEPESSAEKCATRPCGGLRKTRHFTPYETTRTASRPSLTSSSKKSHRLRRKRRTLNRRGGSGRSFFGGRCASFRNA